MSVIQVLGNELLLWRQGCIRTSALNVNLPFEVLLLELLLKKFINVWPMRFENSKMLWYNTFTKKFPKMKTSTSQAFSLNRYLNMHFILEMLFNLNTVH